MSNSNTYDIIVIGAGIIGLATAFKLKKAHRSLKIAVLEKEGAVADHQTGHNSGVIHSGIYYKPGSLKAVNCRDGYQQLVDFAKNYDIPHEICGKVIVATSEDQRPLLHRILERGSQNGLEGIRLIDPGELKEIEPHVKGVEAIYVPQSGIINYRRVAEAYANLFEEMDGEVVLNCKVEGIRQRSKEAVIVTTNGEFSTKVVVNCAGLYADKVGEMTEDDQPVQVVPFRGEYYELKKEKEHLVNNLIYPVPDPNFPFLGVHYTRMIDGGIEAGPNAVLAFKREGYSRWDFDWQEFWETLRFPGFRKLAAKYWKTGLGELYRSYSKAAFVKALQHLIPEVGMDDLVRGGAGVRAMACRVDGQMVDDYLITEKGHIVNVWNAPSPAATSSLAIGDRVAERVFERLEIQAKISE